MVSKRRRPILDKRTVVTFFAGLTLGLAIGLALPLWLSITPLQPVHPPPSTPKEPESGEFFVVLENPNFRQNDFVRVARDKGFTVKEVDVTESGLEFQGVPVSETVISQGPCLFLFAPRGVKIEGTFNADLFERVRATWKGNVIWTTMTNLPARQNEERATGPKSVVSGFTDQQGSFHNLLLEFSYKVDDQKIFHEDVHNQAQWARLKEASVNVSQQANQKPDQ
jgi:hypothetical protein